MYHYKTLSLCYHDRTYSKTPVHVKLGVVQYATFLDDRTMSTYLTVCFYIDQQLEKWYLFLANFHEIEFSGSKGVVKIS